MRNDIKYFADEMEEVMKKHDAEKGNSWKDCDLEFLEDKLDEEYKEWKSANKLRPARNEVVDIANICMMLFHRYVDD